MREQDAIFGGEHSGHFYFRDNFYADCGLIALLTVLDALSVAARCPLGSARAARHRVRSGEINSEVRGCACNDCRRWRRISASQSRRATLDHLDGLTVEFPDWWFNLRPSNTQPLLRLNVEADTPDLLETQIQAMLELVRTGEPMYE